MKTKNKRKTKLSTLGEGQGKLKIIAIIPARYASKRLPGKALALVGGKPMIERVYFQVKKSRLVDEVIVATDDVRIKKVIERIKGKCVMTSPRHKSGTDRIAEAAQKIEADIIVNVQGDEPLINPETIDDAIIPLVEDRNLDMSSVKVALDDKEKIKDRNIVKVVTDKAGNAVSFSRSGGGGKNFKHIGLYVYRKSFLLTFSSWTQTKFERSERLEQMRALENGVKIKIVESRHDSIGVDTSEDLRRVNEILQKRQVLVLVTEYNKVDFFLAIARDLEKRDYTVLFVCGWLSTYLEMRKRHQHVFFIDSLKMGNDMDRKDIETNLITYLQFYSSVSKNQMRQMVPGYADKLYGMIKKFRPGRVLVWNGGQLLEAIGKYYATKENIPVLHFEKGYFSDTLIADFNGVNYLNSFNGRKEQSIDQGLYDQFIEGETRDSLHPFRNPANPHKYSEFLYYSYFFLHPRKSNIKDPIGSFLKYKNLLEYRLKKEKDSTILPSHFIFLPLQLESDSQIILHSPHFKDMFSLVSFVYAHMPKDLWLVVKTHPAETNFSSYNKIRAFAQKRRILFLEERSVKELIEKSKAVVTINSTVGIESLLFSKPVVVLGNAFYAGRGFTFDVKELGQFSHMLEEALVSRVDEKKIKEFLYTLRYHYLISGDYRDPKRYPLTPIINLIAGKI